MEFFYKFLTGAALSHRVLWKFQVPHYFSFFATNGVLNYECSRDAASHLVADMNNKLLGREYVIENRLIRSFNGRK